MADTEQQLGEKVLDHVDSWMIGLGHVIKELAQQLGVAAEHVYEVYTKQVFAEGLVWSVLILIGIASLIWFVKFVWNKTVNMEEVDRQLVRSFGTIIPIIGIVVLALFLPHNVLKIINPEYYTIQDLVNMVTTISK
jgi:hypothetical protein